jgi:hypothetical protein
MQLSQQTQFRSGWRKRKLRGGFRCGRHEEGFPPSSLAEEIPASGKSKEIPTRRWVPKGWEDHFLLMLCQKVTPLSNHYF